MKRQFLLVFFLLSLLMCASALADKVAIGNRIGGLNLTITFNGTSKYVGAGLYEVKIYSDADVWKSTTGGFCVDITQWASTSPVPVLYDSMVNWTGYGVITDGTQSARGQMAAWR